MASVSASNAVQIGVGVAGIGVAVGIASVSYALANGHTIWIWQTIASIAIVVSGGICAAFGAFRTESESSVSQSQTSGSHSTNYQAGRDLDVRNGGEAE